MTGKVVITTVPALWRLKQEDGGYPRLHSEFQVSKGHVVRKKTKKSIMANNYPKSKPRQKCNVR